MIINLNELDNTDDFEDGGPSNALLTYHVTANEDFTHFKPNIPQYKKLINEEFVSLTLKITDQNGNVITDGPQVTIVLHIHDCKSYSSFPFLNIIGEKRINLSYPIQNFDPIARRLQL